jgi:hypothetical protein
MPPHAGANIQILQWEKPRRGLGNFSIGVPCGVAKLEIFF